MPQPKRHSPTPEPWSSRKRWLIAALLACLLAPIMVLCLVVLLAGFAHSGGPLLLNLLSLMLPGMYLTQDLPDDFALAVMIAVQWPICLLLCRWAVGWWDRRRTPVWARDWAKE